MAKAFTHRVDAPCVLGAIHRVASRMLPIGIPWRLVVLVSLLRAPSQPDLPQHEQTLIVEYFTHLPTESDPYTILPGC